MGKRLLFLTTWDFSDGPSTGITKKIKSQIKVFLKQGYEVDYTYISDNYVWIYEKGIRHKIGKTKIGRKFSANLYLANYFRDKRYDFVYNRYGLSDPFFLSLLKRLHENGCTIVVEIPTYPYDREKQSGLLWDILFKIDKIYRVKMNGVVDRIYTYSEDNQIWGIPTICSSNGIDFDLVSIRKVEKKRESINLIAVAGLAKWHGYDRILRGMGEYYKAVSYTHLLQEQMRREQAVAVHVRRGDYLLPENSRKYGNICTLQYYKNAMQYMKKKVPDAKFYFFSNDSEWVRKNLANGDSVIVDCNHGKENYLDMYLMSQCSHNIIANSSFSWWGAWLNQNPDKIVISPQRWFSHLDASDAICEDWVRVNGCLLYTSRCV